MGRTQRKRSRKTRGFFVCDDNTNLILLNSWLAGEGMTRNKKLSLAVFKSTGRGVLTKKKIKAGEELMNLPLNLTINVTTLLLDAEFCSIFMENRVKCLIQYEDKLPFQSLLAFYLTFLKAQGTESKWCVYINNLPDNYTVPYFLPKELKYYIHPEILAVVSKQKNIVESSYKIFMNVLKNNMSNNDTIKKFRDNYKLSEYEWAYFTVNTRCVYMDLTKLIDLKNVERSILNVVCDTMNISLCPFLDMLNHSPNAKNEAKLIVSKNICNISIEKLKSNIFSEVRFSICTKNSFEEFTEVFICYGDSHNLKLITEYGFYLPNNELDCVTFDFNNVKSFLNSRQNKLSQDQLAFISSHGLNKDLYIDYKGLSFNFYALLMVVKYYYDKSKDVGKLIYSAAICQNDVLLNALIEPLVIEKLEVVKESICEVENLKKNCVILGNYLALMLDYVKILEDFIKC